MSEAEPKALTDLKAGDGVARLSRWNPTRIVTIDRVTPTGRIVIGTTTFAPDGREMGTDSWSRDRLEVVTPKHREDARQAKANSAFDSLWNKHREHLPATAILAMIAIVEAAIAPTEGGTR